MRLRAMIAEQAAVVGAGPRRFQHMSKVEYESKTEDSVYVQRTTKCSMFELLYAVVSY